MKILIGYDGSECAEAALHDLQRAGLPPKAEVRIISVSEMVLPPPMSYTLPSTGAVELQKVLEHNALDLALEASRRIQTDFPEWVIEVEAHPGSPANAIISLADEWHPDLIVVGSHGRSAMGRLILGSVSQTVLNEAHCSVRVARGRVPQATGVNNQPVRIVVGVDGSKIAEAAVEVIARRSWPRGSQVRIVNADFNISPVATEHILVAIANWIAEERARISQSVNFAMKTLQKAGLETQTIVKPGDAKQLLLDEAESWKADCIFLGAKNLTRAGRLRLGSVSSSIAARAHCSVEVIRTAG